MIPAIVLAAGASSRMERPKALLPTGRGGETFAERLVSTLWAGGADDVVVVVRPDLYEAVSGQLAALHARVVVNDHPERGQLSSLIVALDTVDRPGVGAIVVTPIDLPLLDSRTVAAVLDAYQRTGARIVRPERQGRHGHPVLFDRVLFRELRRADPAQGMRSVVHAHLDAVVDVAVEEEGGFVDVDTPEEYRAALGRSFDDPQPPR